MGLGFLGFKGLGFRVFMVLGVSVLGAGFRV
jgi:hypothetical protein